MRNATKAVLLSAFVFPGAGHLLLKRYLRGAAFMGLTAAGLAVIVVTSVQKALLIAEQLQSGQVALDAGAVSNLLSASTSGAEGLLLNLASYGVLLCWVLGIFDSYWLGTSHDAKVDRTNSER